MELVQKARDTFQSVFGGDATACGVAPGRVEVLGNHTDYNDALVRLDRTKTRKDGDPNPWVVGKAEVTKYLDVVEECAKSWLAVANGQP